MSTDSDSDDCLDMRSIKSSVSNRRIKDNSISLLREMAKETATSRKMKLEIKEAEDESKRRHREKYMGVSEEKGDMNLGDKNCIDGNDISNDMDILATSDISDDDDEEENEEGEDLKDSSLDAFNSYRSSGNSCTVSTIEFIPSKNHYLSIIDNAIQDSMAHISTCVSLLNDEIIPIYFNLKNIACPVYITRWLFDTALYNRNLEIQRGAVRTLNSMLTSTRVPEHKFQTGKAVPMEEWGITMDLFLSVFETFGFNLESLNIVCQSSTGSKIFITDHDFPSSNVNSFLEIMITCFKSERYTLSSDELCEMLIRLCISSMDVRLLFYKPLLLQLIEMVLEAINTSKLFEISRKLINMNLHIRLGVNMCADIVHSMLVNANGSKVINHYSLFLLEYHLNLNPVFKPQTVAAFDIIQRLQNISIKRCADGGDEQVEYRRALLTSISLIDMCANTLTYAVRPPQRCIKEFVIKLDQWEKAIPMSMDYHSIKLKEFICFLRTKYKPMVIDGVVKKIRPREIRDIFKATSTK